MIKEKYIFRNYPGCALLVGWMLLLFACSDDSPEQKSDATLETVTISLQTKADGAEIIPVNELDEHRIETFRMYAFNEEGKLSGYHYQKFSGDSSQYTFTLKLPTGWHVFYAIANEEKAGTLKKDNMVDYTLPGPIDGSEVVLSDMNIDVNILASLTFSKLPAATYVSGGDPASKDETGKTYMSPLLPMAGIDTVMLSKNSSVTIPMTRSVAKMQLYFSTTGAGECYMGRGLYLYNEPAYGYLFPREDNNSVVIGRRETPAPSGWEADTNYNDSHLHQMNGRVILNSGWSDEPENYGDTEHTEQMKQLDINRIAADMNNPLVPQYDTLPQKSFYLFANPNKAGGQIREDAVVTTTKPNGDGYYLKILVHQHGTGQTGAELHKGEKFYLPLPAVKANDRISIYSVVTLDGYVTLTPHWLVKEWSTGGGDIVFN